MSKKRPRTPLDELIASLKADPEYAAQWRKERDEKIQRSVAQYRIDEAPVLAALHHAGVPVSTLEHLYKTPELYPKAIPVLLDNLRKPHPDEILGAIARALGVREARFVFPTLAAEYRKRPPSGKGEGMGPKDRLAATLSVIVTKETIDELIALAKDSAHGNSRLLLLAGIKRSRTPQAKQALQELAFDPQLAKEIASWKKSRTETKQ